MLGEGLVGAGGGGTRSLGSAEACQGRCQCRRETPQPLSLGAGDAKKILAELSGHQNCWPAQVPALGYGL